MNNKIVRISALFVLMTVCAFAQKKNSSTSGIENKISLVNRVSAIPIEKLEEVVISDSKFALPREKSGKVIVKITSEDLKKQP